MKSNDAKGVTFETAATLKGKADSPPFTFLELHGDSEASNLLKTGATVLCLVDGDEYAMQNGFGVAMLYVGDRCILGVSPVAWRGEKNWFTFGEHDFSLTFEGTQEALRAHIEAILERRETVIAARAPRTWTARGGARTISARAAAPICSIAGLLSA